MARIISIHAATVTASREGARFGAAVGDDGGTPRYVDCDGIREAVRRASDAVVSLADADIRISYDNGSGTARSQPCTPHGTGPVASEIQNLDRILVEVTTQYQAITPIIGPLIGQLSVVSLDRRTIVTEIP